jgi:hypothetical protein
MEVILGLLSCKIVARHGGVFGEISVTPSFAKGNLVFSFHLLPVPQFFT